MESKYIDQSENFNADQWKKSTQKMLEIMRSVAENSTKGEREDFQKHFPNESWGEYEAKIKEDEKKFPVADRKFLDESCQALYAEMWLIRQQAHAKVLRGEKLVAK